MYDPVEQEAPPPQDASVVQRGGMRRASMRDSMRPSQEEVESKKNSRDSKDLSESEQKKADDARADRRRSSLAQFSVGGNVDLGDVMGDLNAKMTADMSPEDKMEKLMIMVKQAGMETKKIFEYFDKDGDAEITPDEFKVGERRELVCSWCDQRTRASLSPADARTRCTGSTTAVAS